MDKTPEPNHNHPSTYSIFGHIDPQDIDKHSVAIYHITTVMCPSVITPKLCIQWDPSWSTKVSFVAPKPMPQFAENVKSKMYLLGLIA